MPRPLIQRCEGYGCTDSSLPNSHVESPRNRTYSRNSPNFYAFNGNWWKTGSVGSGGSTFTAGSFAYIFKSRQEVDMEVFDFYTFKFKTGSLSYSSSLLPDSREEIVVDNDDACLASGKNANTDVIFSVALIGGRRLAFCVYIDGVECKSITSQWTFKKKTVEVLPKIPRVSSSAEFMFRVPSLTQSEIQSRYSRTPQCQYRGEGEGTCFNVETAHTCPFGTECSPCPAGGFCPSPTILLPQPGWCLIENTPYQCASPSFERCVSSTRRTLQCWECSTVRCHPHQHWRGAGVYEQTADHEK